MSQNVTKLLLGSNLGDREFHLRTAKTFIGEEVGSIKKYSRILETRPIGFESEFLFLNQILEVETFFSPVSLLKSIKSIESKMGRIYVESGQRYQDRIIDIDILTFNDLIFECENLKMPHHQIITRNFVEILMSSL